MSKTKKPSRPPRLSKANHRLAWTAVVILALFTLIALDRFAAKPVREFALRNSIASRDAEIYHNKTFTVVKVIDGDTIDIDQPDTRYPTTRIRMLGIDTPETKHPKYGVMHFGPQAYDYTRKTCLDNKITIQIDTQSPARDKYNRLLGYVILDDGTDLNAQLVKKGLAYADLRFPHSKFKTYRALMRSAAKDKTGLWKNATLQNIPHWLQQKNPDILKQSDPE